MPKIVHMKAPRRGNHIIIRERKGGTWGFSVYSANHLNDGGTSQGYSDRSGARRAAKNLHPNAPIVATVTLPRD